mgnify:CR=1 FL=1
MKQKETTLLGSTQPKIKLALEEKYKKQNEEEINAYERLKKKESDKLPKPTGWRITINIGENYARKCKRKHG